MAITDMNGIQACIQHSVINQYVRIRLLKSSYTKLREQDSNHLQQTESKYLCIYNVIPRGVFQYFM